MTIRARCAICNEPIHPFASLVYTDRARGLNDANIHRACFRAHILTYYPDGRMAQYLRDNPGEYTAATEPQADW
jgi:hypothetical protein